MNDVQTTKAALLQAQAELDARRQDAAQAAERLQMLRGRVSRLRAEEVLDGVSHARRIASDEKEITGLEQTLSVWPDVEVELERRIQAAEAAHIAALEADREQTLTTLTGRESELRERFAAAALALLQTSADIGDIHEQREAIRVSMVDEFNSGRRPNLAACPVNPALPRFDVGWLFHRQHLSLAERALRSSQ